MNMSTNEDVKRERAIEDLVREIRQVKYDVGWSITKGNLATAMWAVAVDITTWDSVRWAKGTNSLVLKQYRHIMSERGIFFRCTEIHKIMDNIFPNVPERYSARLFVMRYLVDPTMNIEHLEYNLNHLEEANEKMEKDTWVI